MITVEELKKFSVFEGLNERELELFVNIAKEETHESDSRIFAEKALAVNLYLLLEGKVEITLKCGNGELIKIDQVEPGEIFGWSAITAPCTFTAAAWTVEKTKLIVVKGERLINLFEINNHLGYRMLKKLSALISRRLRAMESKFVENVCAMKSVSK